MNGVQWPQFMQTGSELRKRVTTGVLGGLVLLLLIIFGGWVGIFLLTVGLSLGMVYEFTEITLELPDRLEKRYLLLILVWLIHLFNLLFPHCEFEIFLCCFLVLFAFFMVRADIHVEQEAFSAHFKELIYSVFGLVYLGLIPLYLPKIHDLPGGVHWIIIFLLIVFGGDTGAYFYGKKYGKTRLYPRISPKKTREGALGGLVVGFLAALLYKLLVLYPLHQGTLLSWGGVIFIPVLVGVTAQAGDLCESFLKRAFDKKDSGSILPGHGGFLDRFDGVVFSLPVMYASIRFFS